MADSTSDTDVMSDSSEFDEQTRPGSTLRKVGPSDLSDSGADTEARADERPEVDSRVTEDGDAEAEEELVLDELPPSLAGEGGLDSDTDSNGTGERSSADSFPNEEVNQDVGFDRVVSSREAGLGGGLDQAEEANLGITDEELTEDDDADFA